MRTRRTLAGLSGAVLVATTLVTGLGGVATPAGAAVLSPTDLGTLGGRSSQAVALNDAGAVVGQSDIAGNAAAHAFVWDDVDGMVDLGTLGGTNSFAYSINEAGTVVGDSQLTGDGADHAFVWDEVNGMVDLGTLGGTNSYASGINESGQIAGESEVAGDGATHAVLWDPVDGMIDLGTLGGTTSAALALNDAGVVVGASSIAGDVETHAFIWDEVNGMVDLGTLGGDVSTAWGINDTPQVVGRARPAVGSSHAFIWDEVNGMVDLGTLGGAFSAAYGINASGQAAGYSDTSVPFQQRAFIWDEVDGMVDLGTLGGGDSFSYAINASGQVAGMAQLPNGRMHAARWSTATGSVSVGDASILEGDGSKQKLAFTVTLSDPSPVAVTVGYAIEVDGSPSAATAPAELDERSGTVTFKPGGSGFTATSKVISATLTGDAVVETDETFRVVLSNPTGGFALGASTATGTIIDDDPTGGPVLGVGDVAVIEGDTGLTGASTNPARLRVTLSEPAPGPVTVTATVTAGSATPGVDYKQVKATRTLTFKPGQVAKQVSLGLYPDLDPEGDETVTVALSAATGATIARAVGTVTVVDDD